MDHIDEHLALAAISLKYDISIRAALSIGKKTLTSGQDDSRVWKDSLSWISNRLAQGWGNYLKPTTRSEYT